MKRVIERETKNERVGKGDRDTYRENDIYIYIYRERQTDRERDKERIRERGREGEREIERIRYRDARTDEKRTDVS